MMKIHLRPATGKEISKTTNHIFTPLKSIHITLFPIPEWLQEPKCESCGGQAKFLLKEASPICLTCLNKNVKNANREDTEEDLSVPFSMQTLKQFAFEWSVDGEKWYRVYGKNIKPENEKIFIQNMRDAMLNNKPIMLDADYDKDTKTMTVY
jgi:hypothetical protein